ncbi:MAG: ATP-binding protein, partial [Oscillospiraceae bacterium]|nr:ATP-binding protein [Oscillospiraceae bacterium]
QLNKLRYNPELIELVVRIDENTPLNLLGDEIRIKQILNNVLSNAFKYTKEGKIEFVVSSIKKGSDVILVFKISDTGFGMSSEQIELLFDKYTRFNVENDRNIPGTGLGMSITKRLLEIMDGSIVAASKIGVGTTFTIQIPQKQIDSAVCGKKISENFVDNDGYETISARSNSYARSVSFNREDMSFGSVLIVDDVESNIFVTSGLLEPYKLKIDSVKSGRKAIERIKSGNIYDIIFMDHMMPEMNGIEATKILREMGYKKTIIVFTANAITGNKEMFLKNGFDDFISKPIDSGELNVVLNKYIKETPNPKKMEAVSAKSAAFSNALAKAVAKDIGKAISTFEKELAKQSDMDYTSYITTAHGLKSALLNIGESELSKFALMMETAGKNKDIEVILKDTPTFVEELQAVVDRFVEGA